MERSFYRGKGHTAPSKTKFQLISESIGNPTADFGTVSTGGGLRPPFFGAPLAAHSCLLTELFGGNQDGGSNPPPAVTAAPCKKPRGESLAAKAALAFRAAIGEDFCSFPHA